VHRDPIGSFSVANETSFSGELDQLFRDAMSRVCTPVSVVTVSDGTTPHGTTVSAFASLSMDPPMVLVSLDKGSELRERVEELGHFGLNVLASKQSALALRFAKKGADDFAELEWDFEDGRPRFEGVAAWLGCDVVTVVEGGDHRVVFGEVRDVRLSEHARPLTYHGRVFGTHGPLDEILDELDGGGK
jgi:flavin reductase (DIM6/NTAB) family NADH-FMN oxidoreductase RutF